MSENLPFTYTRNDLLAAYRALEPPFEGDAGTWSHCGRSRPHRPHRHTVYMNEGPTPDVLCRGTEPPLSRGAQALVDNVTTRRSNFAEWAENLNPNWQSSTQNRYND